MENMFFLLYLQSLSYIYLIKPITTSVQYFIQVDLVLHKYWVFSSKFPVSVTTDNPIFFTLVTLLKILSKTHTKYVEPNNYDNLPSSLALVCPGCSLLISCNISTEQVR